MDTLHTFYRSIDKIRHIERRGWPVIGVSGVKDTIASHSFGATLLGWIFAKREGVDENKIIKLLLIHDLVMARMHDHLPQEHSYIDKRQQEQKAAHTLLAQVPAEIRDEFSALLEEYQQQHTQEAKLARECDKLDTLFQCSVYSERLGKNHLLSFLTDEYKQKFQSATGRKLLAQLREKAYD
jgi:putative hydrolases of HD superfamily